LIKTVIFFLPLTVLQATSFELDNNTLRLSAFNTHTIEGYEGPMMSITVSWEILQENIKEDFSVRVVSAVYRKITSLLSHSLSP